jgi:hypothetical protein
LVLLLKLLQLREGKDYEMVFFSQRFLSWVFFYFLHPIAVVLVLQFVNPILESECSDFECLPFGLSFRNPFSERELLYVFRFIDDADRPKVHAFPQLLWGKGVDIVEEDLVL